MRFPALAGRRESRRVRVILASGSPRRREFLAALVGDFEVVPADIEEPMGRDAVTDARSLAGEKARHVATNHPGAVVIGADTIVFDEQRSYGKPSGPPEAAEMLRELRARDHRVVTGIAVATNGRLYSDAAVSTVTLADLTEVEIERFVASGVPLDKAGAYAIQYEAIPVVSRLEGCYCNVVGLPLWRLRGHLIEAGVECAAPNVPYARCADCPDRPRSS